GSDGAGMLPSVALAACGVYAIALGQRARRNAVIVKAHDRTRDIAPPVHQLLGGNPAAANHPAEHDDGTGVTPRHLEFAEDDRIRAVDVRLDGNAGLVAQAVLKPLQNPDIGAVAEAVPARAVEDRERARIAAFMQHMAKARHAPVARHVAIVNLVRYPQ